MRQNNDLQKRLKAVKALKKNTKSSKRRVRKEPPEKIYVVFRTILCDDPSCDGEAKIISAFKTEEEALVTAINYKDEHRKVFVQEITIGKEGNVRQKLLSGDKLIPW